jgi:yeast amino acid transporter
MEGISELVQCFPAPNAIVEYVKTFVDEDLGWVVGIAYWLVIPPSHLYLRLLMWLNSCRYAFGALFAAQIIAATALSRYWSVLSVSRELVSYILGPGLILIINFQNVWVWDESHLSEL